MTEKKKILVVDDESQIAEMIADFCRQCGFETKVATSGQSAIETAKSFLPDLITLDLMMPGLSGLEVIEALKKEEATKKIPVIVISSYANAAEAQEALKLSQAAIVKPLKMKVLEEKIGAVLAGNCNK